MNRNQRDGMRRHQLTSLLRHLVRVFHPQCLIVALAETVSDIGLLLIFPVHEMTESDTGRQWFGRRLGNPGEHLFQRPEVDRPHGGDGCLVILASADQSPVEMPSGVTGHDVPEHSLGAAVALTERVEDVEIVVAYAQPSMNVSNGNPRNRLSSRSIRSL